jgi:hypothetical protein
MIWAVEDRIKCDFFMNITCVDNNEAMKQGDEAFNASSLLFLRSCKRFIATIFT